MSKENAKAFVQAILNDEELRKRTEKMKPEEAIPLGKELGLDFTLEEFTAAMNEDRELDVEELGKVAGGATTRQVDGARHDWEHGYLDELQRSANNNTRLKALYCNGNPKGPKHQFVTTYEDRSYFGAWTKTYEVRTCSLCGRVQEVHVKFGDDGTIIHCP